MQYQQHATSLQSLVRCISMALSLPVHHPLILPLSHFSPPPHSPSTPSKLRVSRNSLLPLLQIQWRLDVLIWPVDRKVDTWLFPSGLSGFRPCLQNPIVFKEETCHRGVLLLPLWWRGSSQAGIELDTFVWGYMHSFCRIEREAQPLHRHNDVNIFITLVTGSFAKCLENKSEFHEAK